MAIYHPCLEMQNGPAPGESIFKGGSGAQKLKPEGLGSYPLYLEVSLPLLHALKRGNVRQPSRGRTGWT